jgi:predicted small lipoprotein YifL
MTSQTAMVTRRRTLHSIVCLMLFVLLFAAGGCGQKGDLYLPDESKSERKK